MINVSNEFKELMQTRTDFKEYAEVTFASGSKITLDESQFTMTNNSITDGAALSAVPIGVAIQKIVQLEILNDQEQWESYDFYGARIHLYLTFELSSTTEKVERGYYTVTTPETYGDTIIVTAYDDMYKADQGYDSDLKYPATIKDMLIEICGNCSIPLLSTTFTHDDFTVSAKPDSQYTYRQIISYIAMLAGGNARINNAGYLEILTYADIMGNQYYNNLDQANEDNPDCVLNSWQSLTTDKNDVKVTGVALTVTDSSGQRKILTGEEGYVLSVTNPLINAEDRTSLVTGMADIAENLIGLTFRKFSGTSVANPLIEFMDFVAVKDRRGRLYQSFVTDVTFAFLGSTTVKNSAESAISASATYAGNINTEVQLRRLVSDEKTAREQAVDTLSTALANSSGMYETEETQQDGSVIRYFHDKPTLSESKSVIKFTADAIGVSSDGGKTYPYGFTVTGEMVTRLLATEGINADWIKTGALTVKDSSGSSVFSADMDSGTVTMSSTLISVDGESLDSKFAESKSYTDTQVVEAKTYTDEKTTEANTYTDEQIKDVKAYAHEEITDANTYADKLAEEAKTYTDGQVDEANTYTDTQIATAKETIQQTYATQSSLTQTAAAIRSEVSEEVTTVKTYTDEQIAASEQTSANTYATKSSVSQTASEIRSKVSAAQTSANAAKSSIDNLKVGGRNLLRGTKALNTDITVPSEDLVYDKYNDYACNQTVQAWGGPHFDLPTIMTRHNLKSGDTLTYSVMVMVDFTPESDPIFRFYRACDHSIGVGNIHLEKNVWRKLSVTFTLDDTSASTSRTRLETDYYVDDNYEFGDGNHMYFAAPKLELGNIATDWTPAPEDMATADDMAKITNRVTTAETSIANNKDAIELRATKTEVTTVKNIADAANTAASNAQSTADGVKTDLATNYSTTTQMTSAIKQTADSITSTVSSVSTTATEALAKANSAKEYTDIVKNQYGYPYSTGLIIYGDRTDYYYPVYFGFGKQEITREILIYRGYGEQAPSDWCTDSHKGGLTFRIKANFGGWGGITYKCEILDFSESYATMIGDVSVGVMDGYGLCIWLRGGGTTGARYHVFSDQPLEVTNDAWHVTLPYIGLTAGTQFGWLGGTESNPNRNWTTAVPLTAPNTEHLDSIWALKTATNATSRIEQLKDSITLQLINSDGTVVSQIKMQDDIIKLTGDVIADTLTVAKLFAKDITATGNFQINNGGFGIRLEDDTFKIGRGVWNTLAKWAYISFNGNTINLTTVGPEGQINISSSLGININGTTLINGLQAAFIPDIVFWTPEVDGASKYTTQIGRCVTMGRVTIVSFNIYGTFAGSTTSRVKISGCPVTPTKSNDSGGGNLSGYYSASNVIFTGWQMNADGSIYAVGQATGTTGAKYGSTAIYQKTSGDFSASGTIVFDNK